MRTLRLLIICIAMLAILATPSVTAGSAHAAKPSGIGGGDVGPNCGPKIAKSTGGTWRCSFADDFDGSSLDPAKWRPLLTAKTGHNTGECRVNEPDTIQVGGGTVRLSVVDRGEPFTCTSPTGDYETRYAGGAIHSNDTHTQTYGRFEARIAFPTSKVAGHHSAWWLWPEKRIYGALSGELDVAEWRSAQWDRAVPTVHYVDDGTDTNKTNWKCFISEADQFHTYAMEWTETTLTFLYDGQVCLRNEWSPKDLVKPAPFDEPYFMILNQALGGGHNAPTTDTPFPATMTVDHVRVWQ